MRSIEKLKDLWPILFLMSLFLTYKGFMFGIESSYCCYDYGVYFGKVSRVEFLNTHFNEFVLLPILTILVCLTAITFIMQYKTSFKYIGVFVVSLPIFLPLLTILQYAIEVV